MDPLEQQPPQRKRPTFRPIGSATPEASPSGERVPESSRPNTGTPAFQPTQHAGRQPESAQGRPARDFSSGQSPQAQPAVENRRARRARQFGHQLVEGSSASAPAPQNEQRTESRDDGDRSRRERQSESRGRGKSQFAGNEIQRPPRRAFSSEDFPEQEFDDEGPAEDDTDFERGPARRNFNGPPRGRHSDGPPRRQQFDGPPRGAFNNDGPPPRRGQFGDRAPYGERPQFGERGPRGASAQRPNFRQADSRFDGSDGRQQGGREQWGGQFQRVHPKELQVGQGLRLKLESFTPDGECVAHLGQFVVFVSGGVPGEFVDAIVTTTGADFARARVERGDQRTRGRTMPQCSHFGTCGGCVWQHIDYPFQLKFKTQMLREMLEYRLGKVELPLNAMIPAPEPFGHRNKIYYQFDCRDPETGEGLVFGHNRLHSPELEWVRECPVHNQDGESVVRAVYRILKEHRIPAATTTGIHDGLIGLLVRTSSTTRLSHVVFVATGEHLPLWQSVLEKTQRLPGVEGVHFNLQPDANNTFLGRENRHISGAARLKETVGGVEFQVSPQSFFQTNAGSAQRLFEVVQRALLDKACDPILDLYAGSGLFSLPMAQRGRSVVAVEENPHAVADGLATAAANGITGCEFVQGKVEAVMRKMDRDRKFHSVVLDPPREGCPEWILRLIGRGVRPRRIAYVSCNPQALARDLVMLLNSGYRLDEVQPVDMFPHTAHIEAVAVLTRK